MREREGASVSSLVQTDKVYNTISVFKSEVRKIIIIKHEPMLTLENVEEKQDC